MLIEERSEVNLFTEEQKSSVPYWDPLSCVFADASGNS